MSTPIGVSQFARAEPDAVAIAGTGDDVTYAQLDRRANRYARVVAAAGVTAGARAGVALRHGADYWAAAIALARLGATLVPIAWRAPADELGYLVTDSAAVMTLVEPEQAYAARAVAHLTVAGLRERAAGVDDTPLAAAPAVDYVDIRSYTSGTTGRPKAVLRPAAPPELAAAGARAYLEQYGLGGPGEVVAAVLPPHHLAGFAQIQASLLCGHRVIVLEPFDARRLLHVIERERVTYVSLAPIHFFRIDALAESVKRGADLSSIKRVTHGTAPCPPGLKRAMIDLFPSGAVWETYGGTETMGTIIGPDDWLAHPGSVGRPAPGGAVKILDDDGVELGPHEVGLIYLASPHGIGFRYDGGSAANDGVWRGDVATLGDVGYLDGDGFLYVVDRRKDLIITGGANVYPAEVERVLMAHPAVREVAVVGVPDTEFGEVAAAVVSLDAPVSEADLIAFAGEHLVGYKRPKRVQVVAELPRDAVGKVKKRELREQLRHAPT